MSYLDEGFKRIRGYEGFYSINRDGVIASYFKKGNKGWALKQYPQSFLKPRINANRMAGVVLNNGATKKQFAIKRLVAEAFLGFNRMSSLEVGHKDGNPKNCSADNLFFAKHSQIKHYSAKGKKKHLQLQLNNIDKRQEKIDNRQKAISMSLDEAKEYFKRMG